MSSWITSEWGQQLRELWNEFDPIGVFPVDETLVVNPVDEYDSYHGVILKHLNKGSSHLEIVEELKSLITEYFGMNWNEDMSASTNTFVQKVLDWFERKKPELKK